MTSARFVPVLIGVGQWVDRSSVDTDPTTLASPLDLMEKATRAAFADAGLGDNHYSNVDTLTVVDTMYPTTRNLPDALARRIGVGQAKQQLAPVGGNAPQFLVNRYCEEISNGEAQLVLLSGGEALANARGIIKLGSKPDWQQPANGDPVLAYPVVPMGTNHEKAHGIWPARHVYPLFENSLRGHYGHSIEQHQRELGELLARFSEVAESSPYAWFPKRRTAAEIATATPTNRYVGWPYTKYMNAMNQINQAASLILTSEAKARELGVPRDRWIYLHGCADVNDIWYVSERVNYYSSPAIQRLGERALKMARCDIDDIDYIDIYSCFPSAIQIARDALGIGSNDPRPLTVTGGMPFHGGAGSSYVMNSIAAMVQKLRANPGRLGLVTANGGLLSEHAAGIYGTGPGPLENGWRREDPAVAQREIGQLQRPALVKEPDGPGVIETYTVAVDRDGEPERGIVIGRLGEDPTSPRFLANTPVDPSLLHSMMTEDFLRCRGRVSHGQASNLFLPGQ